MTRLLCVILLLSVADLHAEELSAADLDRRRVALQRLLGEHWEYTMRTSPEWASILGDPRFNNQVSDVSEAAVRADLAQAKRFLKRFEVIDTRAFSEQERLSRDLMVRDLREKLQGAKFNFWQMPVSQYDGVHIFF